jgi:hypothetical protein
MRTGVSIPLAKRTGKARSAGATLLLKVARNRHLPPESLRVQAKAPVVSLPLLVRVWIVSPPRANPSCRYGLSLIYPCQDSALWQGCLTRGCPGSSSFRPKIRCLNNLRTAFLSTFNLANFQPCHKKGLPCQRTIDVDEDHRSVARSGGDIALMSRKPNPTDPFSYLVSETVSP